MVQQEVIPTHRALRKIGDGRFLVNEIFYSIQGEGCLSGIPMVFVRFSDCNLRCSVVNSSFDCDTEFMSGRELSPSELLTETNRLNPQKGWVLFTGGEPGLQLTQELVDSFKEQGWKLAIETNGTIKLPDYIDWVCVSPKSAEHTIRQRTANEVKYVRSAGMAIPETSINAENYMISPAFQPDGTVSKEDLNWCLKLVMNNSQKWRLSVQYHKLLRVR